MTPTPHPLDLADALLKRRRGVVVLDELYEAIARCLREMHAELTELRAKPAKEPVK